MAETAIARMTQLVILRSFCHKPWNLLVPVPVVGTPPTRLAAVVRAYGMGVGRILLPIADQHAILSRIFVGEMSFDGKRSD